MGNVRDCFWLWGHDVGSHNGEYGLRGTSRMTPAEAAWYLGTPNLILVRYRNRPEPPYEQYALALRPLKRLVWSIVGAGATHESRDIELVRDLAAGNPNLCGVMMDDFFRKPDPQGRISPLAVDDLAAVKQRLLLPGRSLDLWVVLYTHQFDLPIREHLRQCDVLTLWTWRAADLEYLERNLATAEAMAPGQRRVLGCYMYDYGAGQEMPLAQMAAQCELGLKWLREGRIEGMIFLASCIGDLGLEAVEWTRQWIAGVGDLPLARSVGA